MTFPKWAHGKDLGIHLLEELLKCASVCSWEEEMWTCNWLINAIGMEGWRERGEETFNLAKPRYPRANNTTTITRNIDSCRLLSLLLPSSLSPTMGPVTNSGHFMLGAYLSLSLWYWQRRACEHHKPSICKWSVNYVHVRTLPSSHIFSHLPSTVYYHPE